MSCHIAASLVRPLARRARGTLSHRALAPGARDTDAAFPLLGWRPVTILAPGPGPDGGLVVESPSAGAGGASLTGEGRQDAGQTRGQAGQRTGEAEQPTIDAAGGSSSSNSQHPYASFKAIPLSDGSASVDTDASSSGLATTNTITTSSSTAPDPPRIPHRPARQHPFDTHAFVLHMERSDFSPGASRGLMGATKQMINARTEEAMRTLLHKEDVENVRGPEGRQWVGGG